MKHNFFLKVVFTVLFNGFFSLSYGTDIYLSSSGVDTNDGQTSGTAVASFSVAQSKATSGATIYVSGIIDFSLEPGLVQPLGVAIAKNLTIQGTSNTTDGFDGKGLTRFFSNTTFVFALKNLKLINGYSGNNNGGAIINTSTGSLNCENLIFDINKTGMNAVTSNGNKTGAAIQLDNVNGATFKKCVFSNNEASKTGAIYITAWAASSTILFEGCAFVGNIAKESFGGSALFIRANTSATTTLNLINCTVKGNKVLTAATNGGAIFVGGKAPNTTNVNIVNCSITENTTAGTASNGAGVYFLNTNAGGCFANLYISNTIIEGNTAAGGAYSDLGVGATSPTTAGGTNTVGYIKIQNSIIGAVPTDPLRVPTATNIVASPSYNYLTTGTSTSNDFRAKFGTFNSTNNYYPLLSNSSAIDYGAQSYLSSVSVTTDQLGNTRPFAGGLCYAGAVEVKAVMANATTNITDLGLTSTTELTVAANEVTVNQPITVRSVAVSPGAKLTVNNTLTATKGITLLSDATGTATLMDNYTEPTINATIQQYVEAGRNWYISTPVLGAPYTILNKGTSVVEFNEATKTWDTVTTGNLISGKGYIQVATSTPSVTGTTGTVVFSNKLTNSGDVPVTVTRTESDNSIGFNLVGNPYPSYLNWSSVIADAANSNIGTTMWYRTKNTGGAYTFATHNGTSGETVTGTANTSISNFIPPMQAFWVRVKPNTDKSTYSTSITFKNTMREHRLDNTNTLKAPKLDERKRLRLLVSNGTVSDETLIYFDLNAQDTFDNYDSPKMFNNSANIPEIYTTAGNEKLVINGLKEVHYDNEIPLGLHAGEENNFSISRTEMTNFNNGTYIILKDKLLNNETELGEGVAYNFTSQISTPTSDRFSLIFRAPGTTTAVNNVSSLKAQVFVNANNQITIIAPEKAIYSIYNAVGQKQVENTLSSSKAIVNNAFNAGVYLVVISLNGQREIQKVVIR